MSANEKGKMTLKEQLDLYKSYMQQNTFQAFQHNLKRAEKDAQVNRRLQERQRQQRVLTNYAMQRTNPAPWAKGGKLQQMQQDPKLGGTQKTVTWTPQMVGNLMDPKSKVNQLIGTLPKEQQDYFNGVKADIQKQLTPQQKKADELLKPQSAGERAQKNKAGLDALKADAAAAGKQAEKKDIWAGMGEQRAEEWTGRPADYAEKKEEYDRGLWDSMHGAGAYDAMDRRSVNWNRMNAEIDREWQLREARAQAQAANGKPFNEQSAKVQMENQASRINEAKKENDQRYAKAVADYIASSKILNDAYSGLQDKGEDWKKQYGFAMNVDNAQQVLQMQQNARKSGIGNETGDIYTMDRRGRNDWKRHLENLNGTISGQTIPNLQKKRDEAKKNYEDAAYMTPDHIKELYGEKYQKGYDEYLAEGNTKIFLSEYIKQQLKAEYDRADSELNYAQAQIKNNQKDIDTIDRLNDQEDSYREFMDPNARKARRAQLEAEANDLEQQLADVDAQGGALAARDMKKKEIRSKLEPLQAELEQINMLATLDDETPDDGTYHSEYDKGTTHISEDDLVRGIATTSADRIYSLINEGAEYEAWMNGNDTRFITEEYSGALSMMPEEKETFNKLYNDAVKNGRAPVEAEAFIQALQPYLNQRFRQFEEMRNRAMAKDMPVVSSLSSLAVNMASPFMAGMTMLGRATGAAWAEDPNSAQLAPARAMSDVEAQVTSDLGEVGGFFYKAGMSAVKNFLRGLPFMGASKLVGSIGTLGEFFAESYYSGYQQKLEATGNAEAAGLYAFTDACISTFFEIASVEKMFSDPTDMLNYFLQVAGAEMSEELFEGIFSPYIHELIDGSNEWKENAEAIIAAGGYEDEQGNWIAINKENANKAYEKALRDYSGQVLESVASAGISAGGPAAFGIVRNKVRTQTETRDIGKAVLNKDVTKGMSWKEQQGAKYDSFMKLNSAAQQMPAGSESRKIADEIAEDARSGRKIGMKKTGKLVRAIMQESNEQIGQVAEGVLEDTIKERLVNSGMESDAADRISMVLKDAMTRGNSPMAWMVISQNEEARKIWNEFNEKEEVKAAKQAQKSVMELLPDTRTEQAAKNIKADAAARMAVAKYVTEKDEEMKEALAAGEKRTGSALEVVAGGKIADVEGFGVRENTNADGVKSWTVTVKLSNGEEVDIDQVKSTNEAGAKVLTYMEGEKGQSIGDHVGTALIKMGGQVKDLAAAVADAQGLIWEAYTGRTAKLTGVSEDQGKELRAAVAADMKAADERAAEGRKELKPGQGAVTMNGAADGTQEFAQQLAKLGAKVRDEAEFVAGMLKAIGMDAEFYYDNSKEGTAEQGKFVGGQGIKINLAGTFTEDGVHRSVIATVDHEATHWLRANSPEAFRDLSKFVLNKLSGTFNLQNEIKRISDNYAHYGEHLTMDGAIEEMVAMSCEQVMTDEKLVQEMQEEDPTLYGKVKDAIRRVVVKLTKALETDAKLTSSRYARAMEDSLNELAGIWKIALDQAKGAQGEGTAAEGAHSYRLTETDEQYMDAVNSGDMETAQRMVDQAAKDAGYTIHAYHGTNADFTVFKGGIRDEMWFGDSPNTAYDRKNTYNTYLKMNNPSENTFFIGADSKFDPTNVVEEARRNGNDGAIVHFKLDPDYVEGTLQILSDFAYTLPATDSFGDNFTYMPKGKDRENLALPGETLVDFMKRGAKENLYDWYMVFKPQQIKSAETVVKDDNGEIIPPSERFNRKKTDIRYSFSDDSEIRDEEGNVLAEVLPGNTITKYSWRTWEETDIEKLTKDLIKKGFKKKDVQKWIQDVNGVAKYIVDHKDDLDYDASPFFTMLKNNQEYVKTLDASTLCAKRLLYQGIFNEIQNLLPNTALMPDDLIKLINMMKKKGHVTPCGFCYVESRRKMLGKYAEQWLKSYEGEYKPKLAEVTTTDGLEKLQSAPEGSPMRKAYDSFVEAMNAKGSANPKVVQTRTEYRGEIRDKLTDGQIEKVKEIGGLRVQSFSDFEVIHMIDMMQAVMDMAARELTSQAYTKVPEFAWVFGDTGMKINLSMVGKNAGYKISGGWTFDELAAMPYEEAKELIGLEYDDVEGMPKEKAMEIRDRYSKNVGTILVGMNENHIIAAMGDEQIDFIIPFHKSGWNKKEMTQINGMSGYKDFTRWQNEKRIDTWNENGVKTIPNKKSKISNFGPVNGKGTWNGQSGYWDFKKTGTQNAIEYLRLCKEDGRVPKFANFLEYDGKGGYRLPAGNDYRSTAIRNGYWKLLIDFKMYDNNGKGSPQTEVRPVFNMEKAQEILENYDGNTKSLPTDHELASQFAEEYKKEHPGRKVFSMRDDTDYDVRQWMETVPEWSLQTEAEKQLLGKYKDLQMKQRLDRERMRKIDRELLNLEAQLTEERTGRVEAEETMENALESAGVSVRDGHWLQKDGKIVGKINADGTISMNKGAQESVYQDLRKAGFGFTKRNGTFRPVISAPQNADGKPAVQAMLGKSEAMRQRDALQIKKQNLQQVMDQQEEKLAEITQDEGFGKMMYQQQKVLDDLQNFGTQQELVDYVARMEKKAREIAARIEKNRKAAEELEKGGIVGQFRKLLGTTTAEQTAAELKKEYSSTWTAKQIRAYLDPIILKMKTGDDFSADVETLAGILVGSDSRNRYETLESLRGLTITLGKGAQKELKAQNSSLKEVRARLAGTGITVKYGDRSTLEADIEDLRAEYPMIPELGDEKDALGNFLNWIDSMKSASAGMEFYDQRIAAAMAQITGKAAGAAKGIYMPNDPKAQQQVMKIMDFVKGLSAETAEAQKTLAEIAQQMGEMQKAGMQATNRATTLMRDVNVAIDYYQKIGKIAADEAKQKKQSAVIEQLKSKHAEEIVKNNAEWRAQIQRDKDAREQLEENRKYKRQINTNLKRMWNLLKNPKGLKNVPEYMQGLAREVLKMFVNNDMGRGSRFLQATQEELAERLRVLEAWEQQSGKFDRNALALDETNVKADVILADLDKITDAMKVLNSYKIYGKNKLDVLKRRGEIIAQIRDGVSEIYSAIKAEQEVQIGDRKVAVEDAALAVAQGTNGKRYREWKGAAGQKIALLHKFIVSGNMTPEYFFRTLGNAGLSDLWENYHQAENRNGLELKKAKDALAKIAEEYGYKNWDMKQKITLNLESGDVEITLGQLMSLWATWKREKTLGPEMSEHLTKGGFFAEVDLRDGLLGREAVEKRAHTVTEEDMAKAKDLLTEEQRKFVDAVVGFMSRDMSELGNEASMAAYGIKLYRESYYFPFQIWNGVKSRKSNDAGAAAGTQDRAFHPSFSKSRMHGANNAVMIGDFMQVATDHIAGMINYATMGLANESLMKVLNEQTTADVYGTKRNTEAIIEEAYGREAMQYLRELQTQLNGGAVKTERSIGDKAISLFRKNAVAGSLSVALQQPLSYIRAAMMIDAKYLTEAVMKEYWKGSYQELVAHSGVAVIKEMGRFDMNAGASAREYLTPEGKESTGRMVWNTIGEYATILPEKMDAWTWTRMWVAVKAEQHALHPEMDMKSDRFLDMCGVRFNDIMRRTQVYDSTLVRSANMRSQNYFMKGITSFMAEPTLTINVLADAVRMAKQGEKGGLKMLGKAFATFSLSAVMQAAVKGLMGSGRNPDEKKTWLENFMYRFWMNLLGEANPFGLIPGYSDMVTLLKDGELSDDAMGAIGKIVTATKGTVSLLLNGAGDKGLERELEDTVGQLVQIFTNIPMKNLMRDTRAMANFITQQPYAKRPTSLAVLKYQMEQARMNTDTLVSVLMKDAGFKVTNAAYYERIYEAKKAGNEQAAQDMIEYLLKGKGVEQKTIDSGVMGAAKKDPNTTAEEKAEFLIKEEGNAEDFIRKQLREGELNAAEARKLLQKAQPEKSADEIWWAVDRIQYQLDTNAEKAPGGYYYRLSAAIDGGKSAAIRDAVKVLLDHGISKDKIKGKLSGWKKEYLAATGKEKIKLKNSLILAYKAIGLTETEANEIINKWK